MMSSLCLGPKGQRRGGAGGEKAGFQLGTKAEYMNAPRVFFLDLSQETEAQFR